MKIPDTGNLAYSPVRAFYKALEVVTDKIYDADGDKSSMKDVKRHVDEFKANLALFKPTDKTHTLLEKTIAAAFVPVVAPIAVVCAHIDHVVED